MQRERIWSGDEDEGETRTRGNILGRDRIGINRSCVRTGSDTRFVDCDMFMCYHGGGIRHRYMRDIKDIFAEMSHEWVHHRGCHHPSPSQGSTSIGVVNSDSEDGTEGFTHAQANQTNRGDGSDSDLDLDYEPPGTDLEDPGSSKSSNSEDLDLLIHMNLEIFSFCTVHPYPTQECYFELSVQINTVTCPEQVPASGKCVETGFRWHATTETNSSKT